MRIIPISNGEITTDDILSTDLFDFDRAQEAPGWLKELRGEHMRNRRIWNKQFCISGT